MSFRFLVQRSYEDPVGIQQKCCGSDEIQICNTVDIQAKGSPAQMNGAPFHWNVCLKRSRDR